MTFGFKILTKLDKKPQFSKRMKMKKVFLQRKDKQNKGKGMHLLPARCIYRKKQTQNVIIIKKKARLNRALLLSLFDYDMIFMEPISVKIF
jgi:hypothetical protein